MSIFPLVSIVTPSYNQADYIEFTIQSVINQDYENIEYIIIDGGSTDKSVEIIKKYSDKLSYWVSEKDKGQSDAINKGWKMAKGEIFSYLNSDDLLASNAVSSVVKEFLKSNEKPGIIYGNCYLINSKNEKIGRLIGKQGDFQALLKGRQGTFISQPASFFNSIYVKKVGYVNENLHYAMDFDLILKISKVSSIKYIPITIASFRIHDNSKSIKQTANLILEAGKVKFKFSKFYGLEYYYKYLKFKVYHSLPDTVKNIWSKFFTNL